MATNGQKGIRMAGDGLIEAGSPQTQLTWMDAKCGETVFTPRFGKAVEINALWYCALAHLAEILPEPHRGKREHFQKLCGRIRRAFAAQFWRRDTGWFTSRPPIGGGPPYGNHGANKS